MVFQDPFSVYDYTISVSIKSIYETLGPLCGPSVIVLNSGFTKSRFTNTRTRSRIRERVQKLTFRGQKP